MTQKNWRERTFLGIAFILTVTCGAWLILAARYEALPARPTLLMWIAGSTCAVLVIHRFSTWLAGGRSEMTEAHNAVLNGQATKLENLLNEDPGQANATDEHGLTPLHLAALQGRSRMATMLIARGADAEAREHRFGFTPLHMVCSQRYEPVVAVICPKMVEEIDAVLSDKPPIPIVEELLRAGSDPNAQAGFSRTPVHMAAVGGEASTIELLLDNGGDASATDDLGFTPLHYAAFGGGGQVARLLLEAGADPTATAEMDYTPLHTAAEKGTEGVARAILEAGLDPNIPTREGRTAVALANQHGHHSLEQLIRQKGGKDSVERG
ncbi:MAG: ankyrin repeat domain-containing protein [Planctomycetota bacterium]